MFKKLKQTLNMLSRHWEDILKDIHHIMNVIKKCTGQD